MFLKNNRPIEALISIICLALLIFSLAERTVRLAVSPAVELAGLLDLDATRARCNSRPVTARHDLLLTMRGTPGYLAATSRRPSLRAFAGSWTQRRDATPATCDSRNQQSLRALATPMEGSADGRFKIRPSTRDQERRSAHRACR